MYRITFLNLLTGRRDAYMNTAFSEKNADAEIVRLKKVQQGYEDIHYGRTRAEFRKEKIKWRNK